MTVNIFNRRSKKVSDFETEIDSKFEDLNKKIDCLQISDARLRQDIRQIVREEIKRILDSRNKRAWWHIA
ncbi:MAG TPA: hypothetical protein VFY55_01085 [Nitrososphaeraceae archaeon]|nr:hypothetical protein [Nitrososphaeraceae archaeon]